MYGAPHAVANVVYTCYRISNPSCDKGAREHSRHKDLALDHSLCRIARHGTLILFLASIFSFASFDRTCSMHVSVLDAACPAELSIPVVMATLRPFLRIDATSFVSSLNLT